MKPSLISLRLAAFAAAAFLCHGADAPLTGRLRYTAFSLREAQAALEQGRPDRDRAESFGGITHLAGLIDDPAGPDIVIVGCERPGFPSLRFEDWVVALRSVHRLGQAPLVSLDPTADTPRTGKLKATFAGGIERTRFGKEMLECDIILKQLALGKLPAGLWGVPSYVALRAGEIERTGSEDRICSRFWYRSRRPTVACRDGVYALLDITVGIDTEILAARIGGQTATNLPALDDVVGRQFCARVEAGLEDLATDYPVLHKARQFIALVSLAEGLRELGRPDAIDFCLNRYLVPTVDVDPNFDQIEARQDIAGRAQVLRVTGGLDLTPYLTRLKRGHTSAFKDVVLRSRPDPHSLTWEPPLFGWEIPGAGAVEPPAEPPGNTPRTAGFCLDSCTTPARAPALPAFAVPASGFAVPGSGFVPPPLRPEPRPTQFLKNDSALPHFSSIGGVALTATAQMSEPGTQPTFPPSGFSLVSAGRESRLAPEEFGRFLTALWAVYYSETDPGISIDPIAPGVKRHLVRYIGNVINLDLGRVMRESDYIMKHWAVGSSRPNLPGFRNPDDIAGRNGVAYVGPGSRFWFVPENLTFRQAGGLVLFDGGRMTLKTEYLFAGGTGTKADPANEEWAAWFTDRYDDLARSTPVLQELFDYAKLVALAKYLKESGTPLLWFLMAYKDLVLTEDSPGTVAELVKDSEHFEGLKISGGVQLVSPPHYVLDETAQAALNEARRLNPAPSLPSCPPPPILTRQIALAGHPFSIVPQHSLACGRDRHGNRYQTDIALRRDRQPGIELVRWSNETDSEPGDFGRGWRLLLPYRIDPVGAADTPFMNVRVPARMRLTNLLSGRQETLAFDPGLPLQPQAGTNTTRVAGWAPADVARSEVLALFLLTDGSFSLKDKLNNVYRFAADGYLTDLRFACADPIHIEYAEDDAEVLEPGAFQIRPGRETIPCANALVPRAITLVDRLNDTRHTYLFADKAAVAGYQAVNPRNGLGFIALLTDGSCRLESGAGNRLDFDPSGTLSAVRLNGRQKVYRSLKFGDQRVEFRYLLHPSGRAFIAKARAFANGSPDPVRELTYRYDADGRLFEAAPITPVQLTFHSTHRTADVPSGAAE